MKDDYNDYIDDYQKKYGQIVSEIKKYFGIKDRDNDHYEKLKMLAQDLLLALKEIKTKYNVYTSINENIVNDILNKFLNSNEIFFYSLKSCFFKKGYICSAASKILDQYVAPINSRVAELLDREFIFIGITNCDEFCCGSYGLNSCYGPVVMPDNIKVGGSSSGASVDAYFCISDISIGTDTGGSCRFPAKLLGIYAIKTTYIIISRYGLIGYAQSLEVVGIISRCLYSIEKAMKVLVKYDYYDSCMIHYQYKEYEYKQKIKVVIIDHDKMEKSQLDFINKVSLSDKFDVEYTEYSLNSDLIYIVYEIISSIELFSSLNRYNRIQYRDLKELKTLDHVYEDRFKFLGSNIRGKIMQGALFLHNQEFRKHYYKAIEQRSIIAYSFLNLFKKYEEKYGEVVIITPDIDNTNSKAMECYNFLSNISGTPCISIPMKNSNKNLNRSEYSSLLVHGNMKKDDLIIYFGKETAKYV